jgi:hypothetical protein
MHQIVLITALSATTGLFGGGRTCRSGQCGSYYTARHAYYAPVATCRTGACPQVYAAAPAAAPQAAPVAAAPAPAPAATYQTAVRPAMRTAYSYYYPTQSYCPNGQCARR